jgi:uncharacterized protein YndB with AHSA1/START domain
MSQSIEVSRVFPVSPNAIYDAWTNEDEHADMTGGDATFDPRVGGRFSAWDGYIKGTILELEPSRRIVQAWRTVDFPKDAADSRVEVLLEPIADGTILTLRHSDIPDGQAADVELGWVEYYFEPMLEYFGAEDIIE